MTDLSKSVLVTGTNLVPASALDLISRRGYRVRHIKQDCFEVDELHTALEGVAGYLIGGYEEVQTEHFRAASQLEAVAWVGTDYKGHVPGWPEAFRKGIAVINTPGANARSVAEFTMLLVQAMARPFTTAIAGSAGALPEQVSPGRSLQAMTMGIIGLGRVGARMASIAKQGFGMDVCYTAPRRNEAAEYGLGITYRAKEELLATCDVVSLHRPALMADEVAELGADEFSTMQPGTIVVNAGHPGLVDLTALLAAARTRGVRAAFDGVGDGPDWDELVKLGPATFLAVAPMAFNTVDANDHAGLMAARAVCDVLDGGTPTLVNNLDFRDRQGR